jgi:hypothetical protein
VLGQPPEILCIEKDLEGAFQIQRSSSLLAPTSHRLIRVEYPQGDSTQQFMQDLEFPQSVGMWMASAHGQSYELTEASKLPLYGGEKIYIGNYSLTFHP